METKKLSTFIRCTCFLLIAVTLFVSVSWTLERKTLFGTANYMAKLDEFYDLPKNSMEYICVGSSHAYCSVNPLVVWKNSGIQGFVLATQQQPVQASYHYIKEAFKTQKPKYVFLEGLMVYNDSPTEGVLYDAIDPLHTSLNKLQMIDSLVDTKERDAYYFNVLKYHSRWRELSANAVVSCVDVPNDRYKGHIPFYANYRYDKNPVPNYDTVTEGYLPQKNIDTLNDILAFVKENGSTLVLMIAPYDIPSQTPYMKAVRSWAQSNQVEILDYSLLLDEIGVDPYSDYVDSQHLTYTGAEKISAHFAYYLAAKGLIPKLDDPVWQSDYEEFSKNYPLSN